MHVRSWDVVWNVWSCDNPRGDLTLVPKKVIGTLNREITKYFLWLSGERYTPTFKYAGEVDGDSLPTCYEAAWKEASDDPLMVIGDGPAAGRYSWDGGAVVIGGTAVVQGPA